MAKSTSFAVKSIYKKEKRKHEVKRKKILFLLHHLPSSFFTPLISKSWIEASGGTFKPFPAHTRLTDLTPVSLPPLYPGTEPNNSDPLSLGKPLCYQVFTRLD